MRARITSNEATPQTDEGHGGLPKKLEDSAGKWTPVEPAGTCPGYKSSKLGGSEDPWTTGARDEHSTIGGGSVAGSCGAGARGDRPNVPQRLCAASADCRGCGGVPAGSQGPAFCVDDSRGADDRGVCSQYRGLRQQRRH